MFLAQHLTALELASLAERLMDAERPRAAFDIEAGGARANPASQALP